MIYKNYEEFSLREKQKQRQNGCTQKFSDKYFNGDLDKFILSNKKNEGCFNCYDCRVCGVY